jgi:hypothetical protein
MTGNATLLTLKSTESQQRSAVFAFSVLKIIILLHFPEKLRNLKNGREKTKKIQ